MEEKLSSILQFRNGKKRPKETGEIPVYGGNGILGYTNESNYHNCIAIGRVGAYCGSVYYESDDCWISDNAIAALPKNCVDIVYAYYLLKSLQLNNRQIGTSQPLLTQDILNNIETNILPYEKQRKVGSILKLYDDTIVLNKKINKNLSDQIQAIYCNKFDPVTHTPSGCLSDICRYSSDRIPVSELTVSTYYSTENMQPNKEGAVNATNLPSIQQTTRCHKGDVLISNIRPYFKKIVYVTEECGCSTDVLCFTPKKSELTAFLFGTLYIDRFFEHMVTGSKGTKMPRGDKQQIMNYPVVIPSEESLKAYNNIIIPMLEQVSYNRAENIRLAALRDTLLPRLMSGEIDVSNLDI